MQGTSYQKATARRNSNQYITCKRSILCRGDLSATQKLILCTIDSLGGKYGDGCNWTNEYLAEFMGCEAKTIANALTELKKVGAVGVVLSETGERVLYTNDSRNPDDESRDREGSIPRSGAIRPAIGSDPSRDRDSDYIYNNTSYNTNNNTGSSAHSPAQNSESKNSPANSEGETPHRETSNPNLAGATPPSSADLDEYETYAEQVLAKPTGAGDWENRNPYMLAGRRPMLKFPEIHLGRAELAEVLRQYDRARIPRNRFPEALAMCVGRLQTLKANGQNPERAAVFNWLTTWIKNELLNAIINETRLAKVEGRI